MDNKQQLLKLARLINAREEQYQNSTDDILELVAPTVVAAVYELFQCSYDDVSWYDVDVVHDILMLVAIVSYKDGKKLPEAIQSTSYATLREDDESSISEHIFRIGVPLSLVFAPSNEIVEYLLNAEHYAQPESMYVEGPSETQEDVAIKSGGDLPLSEFDATKLTPEQIQQLMISQSVYKGSKH